MLAEIKKSTFRGRISVPASKSVAHRALIASALANEITELSGKFVGSDVEATSECLKAIGADIKTNANGITVAPITEKRDGATLNARDSGSTLRFMLPTVAALGVSCRIIGTERLSARPLGDLVSVLISHGITISEKSLPISVSGKLTSGDYKINATVSSQYITGLLFALPLLCGDSRIILEGEAVSRAYIDITLNVLRAYGIKTESTDYGYYVKGGQKYVSPKRYTVESDWSSACFFAVGGAFNGEVMLDGLNFESSQSDKAIIEVLNKSGASALIENGALAVKKDGLKAFDYDVDGCPDIAPILAVLMAKCEGESHIFGIQRLRFKESDRVEETVKMLNAFGIKAFADEEKITVTGGKFTCAEYALPDDHRIAMAAAIAAANCDGISRLQNIECIKKSYPTFIEDFAALGGQINVFGV